MVDREKVIAELKLCASGSCKGCRYFMNWDNNAGRCSDALKMDAVELLEEQETEIRQLRLALDIVKGTCKGIKSGGGQFADMPTM